MLFPNSFKLHGYGLKTLLITGGLVGLLMLPACDLTKNHTKMDRAADMSFQDFRDGMAPRLQDPDMAAAEKDVGNIPSLQSYVAPPSENLKPMPLVSISINQHVPLRDALYDLAEKANYDIQLDPRIKGSVIFTARERPFDVVIQKLADIAGLRYKFEDDSLQVELDTPYHKTYKIDYLSYIRKNKGSIHNDVAVVSGDGTNTGSMFEASSESTADFWGELETNLMQILGQRSKPSELKSDEDPQVTAVERTAAPVQPVVTEGEDGESVVLVQAPEAVLEVQTPASNTSGGNNKKESPTDVESTFALGRQAGIVSVYATEKQHNMVADYMRELKRSVTSQVLIEAKILEVSLEDEFATGIDWNLLENMTGEFSLGFDVTGVRPNLNPASSPSTNFQVGYTGSDITAMIEAISRFGTVRALASPRLTVLNNQSAVLNVANNQVYFEIDIDITQDGGGGSQTSVDSEIRNVPEGVLINVQPSINLDERSISMAVRPTVTRITEFVNDPAVAFLGAGIESPVPVVNVQEMDSLVKIGDGQTVVMGGLMQDRTTSTQQGVPVLSEIPMFGTLFRNQSDSVTKSELVVFIRARIVDGSNLDQTDKDLYRMFSGDRRPLEM